MSNITAEMVKSLRERTGVGMAKCKQALDEANGDIEKAIDILRKAGAASAVKKSDRATNEGLIGYRENDQALTFVEIDAETDFVVKNDKFLAFMDDLLELSLSHQVSSIDQLLNEKLNSGETVEQTRVSLVQSIGENIQVKRVHFEKKEPETSYGLYRHLTGKILSLAVIKGSNRAETLAKDIAMHIAAEAPEYLTSDEIPQDIIEKEKEIARSQIKNKPENIIDKILEGKMKAFYDQVCLVGQKFVKDSSVTVAAHVEREGKALGKPLELVRFVRWEVGSA